MTLGTAAPTQSPAADRIVQVGMGFWASKTLLSAVELGVFTALGSRPMKGEKLRHHLGLHPRSFRDFFDALVALGFIEREGDTYRNTPETALYLDRNSPSYVGGILEMCNARLYGFWGNLTEALRTGQPQNECRTGGNLFDELKEDPEKLREFMQGMTGMSMAAAHAIAAVFPWKVYRTFADVGTAQGGMPVQIAKAHPHLRGIGFDMPVVQPIFEEYVASFGLADRLAFRAGDLWTDPFPGADVLLLGHILHDWSLEQKRTIIAKAYDALPTGGSLVIYEALIDDERRQNAFGLLMSLNMLIETPEGFDFTGADCCKWLKEAGFRETRVTHLVGPDSMVVGVK